MNHPKRPLLKGLCLAVFTSTVWIEFSSPARSQQVGPCRQLDKGDTVVIIEASNNERMQLVNQVVSQHSLKGQFCASRRTGRTVWMSDQLSNVDTAVKVFGHFRAVGLVSPASQNGNGQIQNDIPVSPYPSIQNSPYPNESPNGRGVRL